MSEIAIGKYKAVIPCECGSAICCLSVWPWNGGLSFEFVEEYVVDTWRHRIRNAWRVLRGRQIDIGDTAMNETQAEELAAFITEQLNNWKGDRVV